jgi:hypothetical protein
MGKLTAAGPIEGSCWGAVRYGGKGGEGAECSNLSCRECSNSRAGCGRTEGDANGEQNTNKG